MQATVPENKPSSFPGRYRTHLDEVHGGLQVGSVVEQRTLTRLPDRLQTREVHHVTDLVLQHETPREPIRKRPQCSAVCGTFFVAAIRC